MKQLNLQRGLVFTAIALLAIGAYMYRIEGFYNLFIAITVCFAIQAVRLLIYASEHRIKPTQPGLWFYVLIAVLWYVGAILPSLVFILYGPMMRNLDEDETAVVLTFSETYIMNLCGVDRAVAKETIKHLKGCVTSERDLCDDYIKFAVESVLEGDTSETSNKQGSDE